MSTWLLLSWNEFSCNLMSSKTVSNVAEYVSISFMSFVLVFYPMATLHFFRLPPSLKMSTLSSASSTRKLLSYVSQNLLAALSCLVFLFLDLVDAILCVAYGYLDKFFEGENAVPCYCINSEEKEAVSVTLFEREKVFRDFGFHGLKRKQEGCNEKRRFQKLEVNRWSDCGCESCTSWLDNGKALRLHVREFSESQAIGEDCDGKPAENVIFIHGFMCSSLLWTETLFPHLSEATKNNYKLFALDLLGFGRSPKPRDCLYTLKDHVEMLENSVIHSYNLGSFHVVAHSMGCIVALALAAKYSNSVKSITLIAPVSALILRISLPPKYLHSALLIVYACVILDIIIFQPYFSSSNEDASSYALRRIAGKTLWPPMLFGSAVMSWYEHIGRCICFFVCRNHRIWESILRILTRRRDLILDMTRHTHHSAWHTMHNVICGGAKQLDEFLEAVSRSGARINVIQGDRDEVVPLECSLSIKLKVPHAQIDIIRSANHISVMRGREKEFASYLIQTWASASEIRSNSDGFI